MAATAAGPGGWTTEAAPAWFDTTDELQKRLAKEAEIMTDATAKINDKIAKMTLDTHDYKLRLMEKEIDEYRQAGVNEVRIAEFKNESMEKIEQEASERRLDIIREEIEKKREMWENSRSEFEKNLDRWVDYSSDIWAGFGRAACRALDDTADAFTDMIMGAEVNWNDLARTILADLLRIAIRAQMAQVLGFFGFGFGVAHAGGIVGETSFPKRVVSASTFAGAPRLHGGLASDEYPTILQRGEQVIPKGGGGVGRGGFDVHIHNEGSEKMEISSAESYIVSDQRIIDVSMRAAAVDGPYRRSHKHLR